MNEITIDVFDMAIRDVKNANSSDKMRLMVMANVITEYLTAQQEYKMFSEADVSYIIRTIINEVLDVVLDWNGTTEMMKEYLIEPVACAYRAATMQLLEGFGI